MRKRVDFVEFHVLPSGFSSDLRAAIAADSFVDYANAGEEKGLERFLEGVADTGRRGHREALRVIYDICNGGDAEPSEVVDLCYRLSVAAEALVIPNLDEKVWLNRLENLSPSDAMKKSLESFVGKDKFNKKIFLDWAETTVPLLSSTISNFVHNLIFHAHPYPRALAQYVKPELFHSSDIFETSDSPRLFSLGCMDTHLNGKWHRLYSSESDGRSFNRLEWSLLGYEGPSLMLIQSEQGSIFGGFAADPWKESPEFHGSTDCFLFQIEPTLEVFRAQGKGTNFMYCNPEARSPVQSDGLHHGIGFGGDTDKPRLFIPESLEECTASYLDTTFQTGDLLPAQALEKFKIRFLEVWGVGGDESITKALRARAEHREVTNSNILKARMVTDKSGFLPDVQSGLIDTKVYKHREQTRGRAEFTVDDVHGGYKLERE